MRKITNCFLIFLAFATCATAQTSVFTYQGKLTDGGISPTGTYAMQFVLYGSADESGPGIGTITNNSVSVVAGIFTVQLDFGPAEFTTSAQRWLEVRVKRLADPGFSTLTPRQQITSSPFSLHATRSEGANSLTDECDECVTDAHVASVSSSKLLGVLADNQISDALTINGGTVNNTVIGAVTPAAATFTNANAQVFNAVTQFNIGGQRVIGIAGNQNTFIGIGAGAVNTGVLNTFTGFDSGRSNTTGVQNSFYGSVAGRSNTTGSLNSYFGEQSGTANQTGQNNAFFGFASGALSTGSFNAFFGSFSGTNTTSSFNSFFGYLTGVDNAGGFSNSFFGSLSGRSNTTGNSNSFFGSLSGELNTTGSQNAFYGQSAGRNNTTGSLNAFFGEQSGLANQTGQNNAFFGFSSGSGSTGSFNAIFGSQSGVNTTSSFNSFFGYFSGFENADGDSNSFYGSESGRSNTTGDLNSFFGRRSGFANESGFNNSFFGSNSGEANTTGSSNAFFGYRAGLRNTIGGDNAFFGSAAGIENLGGAFNSFFGRSAGLLNTSGQRNTFLGFNAGNTNTTGSNNTVVGTDADVASSGLTFATAIGAGSVATQSNSITLGRASDTVLVPNDLEVTDDLEVNGFTQLSGAFIADGQVSRLIINTSAVEPGNLPLCLNSVVNRVNACSSSRRYKENISDFRGGMDLLKRLRPVSFNWKQDGSADLGFVAEEVAAAEPRLAIYNESGEPQGVKYDRIGVILINTVKDQQALIEKLQKQLDGQAKVIERLKRAICSADPEGEMCN